MKNKFKFSIVGRTFFLLSLVILFQSLLSFYTIVFTDITTTVETFSVESFTRTVSNRQLSLENLMTSGWSNIGEISAQMTTEYTQILGENDSLTEEEKVDFLENITPSVVQMILLTGTTGGFVILDDGEEMTQSYSAVYLKSYDNVSQAVNSDNLMLARGPAEVSKGYGFSLVANWSYGLSLTQDNYPMLRTPMDATEQTKQVEYLGFWHVSTDIANENSKVLTCTMPILDGAGEAIGVVGIEISQEYLFQFLPSNEFGTTGSHGYVVGMGGGDSFTPYLVGSDNILTQDVAVSLENMDFEEGFALEIHPQQLEIGGTELCVLSQELEVYVNHSPFESQSLWIMGMVEMENITSFTAEFWQVIQSMLIVTTSVGILVALFVGRNVAKPIVSLSKILSSYGEQDKISLPESSIREIDELSNRIVKMQENILRSTHRTDKILDLMEKGVGSFEYVTGTEHVTISTGIYRMLGLEAYQGIPIPKGEFFQTLENLKGNPVADLDHIYALTQGKTAYYKVEEFAQEDILLGVIEERTQEVESLLVLNYERNYDVLTGILNRRAFHKKAQDILQTADLKVAGFVMFDLDNLKYVNDTFGHDSGDVYIKTAATTLNAFLSKFGVVGRMSGDEFYALLYGFPSQTALNQCLKELYAQFEQEPITMPNGGEFKIRISGGIAWYGQDSSDLEELKKYADFAMYKGKHTLKGQMRQFDKKQYLEESFMLSGKAELNRLLDNELLNFVFQPIIEVKTGKIYAYEALMRPESEILGSPLKLLQLAGLEGKLWKVEKIALFKTLSLYKKYGEMFQDARIFINSIPSESLKEEEYAQMESLFGDCFSRVVIEITEQEQLSGEFLDKKLEKLKSLQLDTALDDYGSGYANDLGLIKIMPKVVKIDRSLISNVHVDPSRQAIVRKIIAFCKEHDITVLGEGIETEQELEYLMGAGIELAQGYYIARPMPQPNFQPQTIQKKIAEIHENTGI